MAASKRAGKALLTYSNRIPVQTFEALVPLTCVRAYPAQGCDGAIPVGALFVRVGYPGGGMKRAPACQDCEPFDLIEEGEES